MHHRSMKRTRSARTSVAVAAVAVLGIIAAACAPAPPTDPPTGNQQFCEFFEKVDEAPPAADSAVLVKDDVVALADETEVTGQECTDPGAKVELDGAVLAEGEEVPSELDTPDAEPIAAVTGEELASGEPVLENVSVQTLSADIGPNGITLRGNVALRISGQTSTIGFVGTLSNLDNWSINLSSSALTIPGITSTPATFTGTLRSTNGNISLDLTAGVTSAKIGDVRVNGATVNLSASQLTGVSASVTGAIKIGPSSATGTVDVTFDRAGALVAADADIAVRLVGTQAGGQPIDLEGTVKLEGNADETVASFSGSGVVGDLVVNEANGSLTLATNKATFIGKLDVAQGPNTVRFNGSIIWDGITASTPFLTLEGGGEFSGTLQNGQQVSVAGTLETTIIGGQARTVVEGDFQVGTLKASGSAIVETNGATTSLIVDADLVDAGFDASLAGAVIITDGRAETVSLSATVNGSLSLGDATLTGANLSIDSTFGSPLELSFSGGLQVGTNANLTAAVEGSFGPNGTLLSLAGQVNGSLTLDSWGLLNFNGSVLASPEQVTLTGAGGISTINFPLGINFNGSFTSSLTEPSWSLNGSGNFRIASINVASARLSLSQEAGMRATRVGFYFNILFIPTYFEADFFLNATGGCDRVVLTGGSFLAKPILRGILPGVVGCPVL